MSDNERKLTLENARLKRKLMKLTQEYNDLRETAISLNAQVKEYSDLANLIKANCDKQLDITETFTIGPAKKFK